MTSSIHNRDNNGKIRRMYQRSDMTKQQLAEIIGVKLSTVIAWLKPETSKSSNAAPDWAVDKLKAYFDTPIRRRKKKA